MKTIVWDVDDVLNDLMRAWFEGEWRPSHSECRLAYADLKENPPHRLLGVERAEYLDSLDRFRLSAHAENMSPDAVLLKWFEHWGRHFRHIALTARPEQTVYPALKWTLHHFGRWFQTFSFVPSERPGQLSTRSDKSKKDFLVWLGRADYFIDDCPGNVEAAANLGLSSFLVSRPWNNGGLELIDILNRIDGTISTHDRKKL